MTVPVHCEVMLAVHFRKQGIKPVEYIGVSKLSCYSCLVFLDCLNATTHTGPQFLTRGCHGSVYFPWGFPELSAIHGAASIRSSFVEYMAKEFKRQLKLQNRDHARSNSSTRSRSDDETKREAPAYVLNTVALRMAKKNKE